MHIEAQRLRLEREHKARAWLAWHTAALGRMKTMPQLEELSGPARAQPRQQTWQQQRDIARIYTAMLGGTITIRSETQ